MRVAAGALGIALALLVLVPLVNAHVQTEQPISFTGATLSGSQETCLLSVKSNKVTPTTLITLRSDACGGPSMYNTGLFTYGKRTVTSASAGVPVTGAGSQPGLWAYGVYYTPLGQILPYFDSGTAYQDGTIHTSSYPIQSASICVQKMQLDFSTNTGYPDLSSSWEYEDQLKSFSSCQSAISAASNIPAFEGYAADVNTRRTQYQFPIFCGDINVTLDHPESSDWAPFMKTYLYSKDATKGSIAPSAPNNGNYFHFDFTYDQTTGELDGFTVGVDDGSAGAGGFHYTVTCMDPISPDSSQSVCAKVSGYSNPWESAGAPYKCCYAPRLGQTTSVNGQTEWCTSNGWDSDIVDNICDPQSDGTLAGSSLKSLYDSTSKTYKFCCKPGDFTPIYPPDNTTAYFCTGGNPLITPFIKPITDSTTGLQWAYNGQHWLECTQATDRQAAGSYICDGSTQQWNSCQTVNGKCCAKGVYDTQIVAATSSTPAHTIACFNGYYVDESKGPTEVTIP